MRGDERRLDEMRAEQSGRKEVDTASSLQTSVTADRSDLRLAHTT
jgi:hypothetical protein